ncbi:MAG: hypothetical protein AVDCRST_MAG49-3448 [uncultured Thermomicrobiales bacterium]|uniref:Signal transduction histidine kinase dimerisation/phosphoacceptor domain-containing protein n=1 Tax=uncultured Thermomicrobiales bacterium TaxID=1645740 RepID=A0A6J4V7H6_9BACT|nr:MAG: hypothetical protein AVDCRST_MAG49-3448 [uncultured Thermomicrobiales bacterium]
MAQIPTPDLDDTGLNALNHDLQNALTAIKGQAQLAHRRVQRDEVLDRERLGFRLGVIEDVAMRISSVLGNLAAEKPYYRSEPGRPPPMRDSTPVDD